MKQTLLSMTVGVLIGVGLSQLVWLNKSSQQHLAETEKKPLYWVAPMDPNYKRDKPGKSPMGMDLVPVYEQKHNTPGTVLISPEVVNNLGVRTDRARMAILQTNIKTVGYVQYDQDRLVHIHPRVEGWIETLYVKSSGDPVKRGQPLYALYSPQLVNAQEELLLALNRDNALLVQAAQQRLRSLHISDVFIEQLTRKKEVQQTITFYAQQSGVVDNLNIREGFFVKPGTTLMSIGALDEVWVEAQVFERQASLVSKGLAVTMTLDYLPSKRWQGHVDYVYPTLDPNNRTARVRLRFMNPDGLLKPNMFALVNIHANNSTETLVIPRAAVIRTGDQDRVVLALGQGRFKSLEVTLGRLNDSFAEITKGLQAGDTVVTSAQFLLDSESSKTSDFSRMHHSDKQQEQHHGEHR